jgi:superfamily II DNA or RNA helicase
VSPSNSSSPTLRPYQQEAIDAVLAARRGGTRRMVVCLPTGAGKTVIFSQLARLARRQVLVLAHREELLGQAREKLERARPESVGHARRIPGVTPAALSLLLVALRAAEGRST